MHCILVLYPLSSYAMRMQLFWPTAQPFRKRLLVNYGPVKEMRVLLEVAEKYTRYSRLLITRCQRVLRSYIPRPRPATVLFFLLVFRFPFDLLILQ